MYDMRTSVSSVLTTGNWEYTTSTFGRVLRIKMEGTSRLPARTVLRLTTRSQSSVARPPTWRSMQLYYLIQPPGSVTPVVLTRHSMLATSVEWPMLKDHALQDSMLCTLTTRWRRNTCIRRVHSTERWNCVKGGSFGLSAKLDIQYTELGKDTTSYVQNQDRVNDVEASTKMRVIFKPLPELSYPSNQK